MFIQIVKISFFHSFCFVWQILVFSVDIYHYYDILFSIQTDPLAGEMEMADQLNEYDIYIDGKYFKTQKLETSPEQLQQTYKLLSLSNNVEVVLSSQPTSSDERNESNPQSIN